MTVKDSQIVAIHPSSVLHHKPEVYMISYESGFSTKIMYWQTKATFEQLVMSKVHGCMKLLLNISTQGI